LEELIGPRRCGIVEVVVDVMGLNIEHELVSRQRRPGGIGVDGGLGGNLVGPTRTLTKP
jgi:hypothetical protein